MKSFLAVAFTVLSVIAAVESSLYSPALGPPCPKSVVVGCAPLVQKVPCKGGAPALGAYSEYAPQYAPQYSPEEYSASASPSAAASEVVPQYYAPQYLPQNNVQYAPQYTYY